MEQRQGNIIIHASGGTSGKGAQTYKLALPSSWAKQIGITGQERSAELSFDFFFFLLWHRDHDV